MRLLFLILLGLSVSAEARDPDRGARNGRRIPAVGDLFRLVTGPGLLVGSRGETVAFTRASDQYCLDATGIAMTSVTSNVPCVDARGVLSEPAATNLALRSNAFDNAAWTKFAAGTGVTAIATANACTAPDGTATADRVQFNLGGGTTTGDTSGVQQDVTVSSGAAYTQHIWVKSNDGSSTKTLQFRDTLGGLGTAPLITLTPTWQKVTLAGTTTGVTSRVLLWARGSITTDTADACVWQGSIETGSVATSEIITAGTSATRAATVMTVPTPGALSLLEGCSRVAFAPAGWSTTTPGAARILDLNAAGTARALYYNTSQTTAATHDGTNSRTVTSAYSSGAFKYYRTVWSDARNVLSVTDEASGSTSSGAFVDLGFPSFGATFAIGSTLAGTVQPNGMIRDVVLGSHPDGCRQ